LGFTKGRAAGRRARIRIVNEFLGISSIFLKSSGRTLAAGSGARDGAAATESSLEPAPTARPMNLERVSSEVFNARDAARATPGTTKNHKTSSLF
jgi:hypothetical protein